MRGSRCSAIWAFTERREVPSATSADYAGSRLVPYDKASCCHGLLIQLCVLQCDRERPTCHRCRRSNRRCSGYEAQYLFMVPITPGRPQLQAPHQRTHSGLTSPPPSITSDSPSSSVVEIAAPTPVHHDVPILSVPHFVLEQQRPVPNYVEFPNIRTLNSPTLFQTQLLANYTDAICPNRGLPRELCLFREWLGRVPYYLGTSDVLGHALECLTRAYYARSNNPDNRKDMELASCEIYGRAIATLRRVLITSEYRSSQTLCATLFLSQYEASHGCRIMYERAATNCSCSFWLVPLASI